MLIMTDTRLNIIFFIYLSRIKCISEAMKEEERVSGGDDARLQCIMEAASTRLGKQQSTLHHRADVPPQ